MSKTILQKCTSSVNMIRIVLAGCAVFIGLSTCVFAASSKNSAAQNHFKALVTIKTINMPTQKGKPAKVNVIAMTKLPKDALKPSFNIIYSRAIFIQTTQPSINGKMIGVPKIEYFSKHVDKEGKIRWAHMTKASALIFSQTKICLAITDLQRNTIHRYLTTNMQK